MFYLSQYQHILVENVKLGILDACVYKNIYIKEKLCQHFLLKTGFTQVFAKTLTTSGFRCGIISHKFLMSEVKTLPQKNASLCYRIYQR